MNPFTDISSLLGYASILFWLFAQFPQVLENIRRRSCEGLALPFLANWLLGDISNLIGCILTHQLPFQTWLASYFVTVDMMLVCQYFYYQHVNPPRARSRFRRMSVDRPSPRYRTLSAVASNVAAAAALAAQHEEHIAPRRTPRWPQSSRDTFFDSSASRISRDDVDADDLGETAFSALADSFHSEGGRTIGKQRRGTSVGRYPTLPRAPHSSNIETSVDSLARGRTLQREFEHGQLDNRMPPSASVGRSSRISKQGSGIVFLGVFALFTLGSMASTRHVSSLSGISITGRIVKPRAAIDSPFQPSSVEGVSISSFIATPSSSPSASPTLISIPPETFEPKIFEEILSERVIGRIFAWVCTILYLTSRLPQIWKNYVRKSVEGLSIYLFVFAFLGNVFYVASILSSPEVYKPEPESSKFLKESFPYLLGSGGTLMFDISIVIQSFIYRSKPRRGRHRSRSRAAAVSATEAEEGSGLLAGDVLAHPSQDEGDNMHSRVRTAGST